MIEKCEICKSDARILKSTSPQSADSSWPKLSIADLFSGCGGLSLGIQRATYDLGYSLDVRLAVDSDQVATDVYRKSFPHATIKCREIEEILDGEPGKPLTEAETKLKRQVGQLDILLGGPPCQGHSNLNNHTRRDDARNDLYLYIARATEVLCPSVVIVENVPTVTRDVRKSVQKTVDRLEEGGYDIGQGVVDLWKLGVPQKRRRHVTMATAKGIINPQDIIDELKLPICKHVPRSVWWAIDDLDGARPPRLFDSPSNPSEDNQRRIKWLFDNDEIDLPNSERPQCHQSDHSYTAMYGRMKRDAPAQTVTTGFNSMGQGRYVHPSRQRVITPHEAARLQTLPDFVDFSVVSARKHLAKLIGNAVPPPLTFELGKRLIPSLKKVQMSTVGCEKSRE